MKGVFETSLRRPVAQVKAGMIFLAAGCIASGAVIARPAATPDRIVIADKAVFPESLTSSRDGRIWIGSYAKGVIYLAKPGAATAEPWISPDASGMNAVLGLLADDRRGLLWACSHKTNLAEPNSGLIPTCIDHDPCAHLRRPMVMMRQG